MPPKGWKSVTIPLELWEYSKRVFEAEKEEFVKKSGANNYTSWMTSKLWESFLYEYEEPDDAPRNPLISNYILEDVYEFVEAHNSDLRRRLKIRNMREFIEDAIKTYLGYCGRVIQRVNEK